MAASNATVLTYDNKGNLTADGTNTFAWDARNHMSFISGGVAAIFVYDALGRRMSKSIAGTTTQFLEPALSAVEGTAISSDREAGQVADIRRRVVTLKG
jgi:hypothetical protein